MPAYPWLQQTPLDWSLTERKLKVFKNAFGVPYTDEGIAEQMNKINGEWGNATEEDALVAYLLSLGQERKEAAQ